MLPTHYPYNVSIIFFFFFYVFYVMQQTFWKTLPNKKYAVKIQQSYPQLNIIIQRVIILITHNWNNRIHTNTSSHNIFYASHMTVEKIYRSCSFNVYCTANKARSRVTNTSKQTILHKYRERGFAWLLQWRRNSHRGPIASRRAFVHFTRNRVGKNKEGFFH